MDRRDFIKAIALGSFVLPGARRLPHASMAVRIDTSNPLAYGLTGAYLPGRGSKTLYDLSGKGASPVCGTSGVFKPTQEGFALDTSAQGGGQGCNAIATSIQQPAKNASLFWRGALLGTPASNEYVFGVEFQDGSTAPFDAYDLVYLSAGTLQASVGTVAAGTFAVTWAAPTGVVIDAALTADLAVAGGMDMYGNGAHIGSSAIITTNVIDYGTNPQLEMGSTNNVGQAAANARHLVGYTWNRTLSATEVMSLHMNPYQLFTWPEEDWLGIKR